MKLFSTLIGALLAGALTLPALAATQEIHGVQVPDSASVAGGAVALEKCGSRRAFLRFHGPVPRARALGWWWTTRAPTAPAMAAWSRRRS